MKDKEEKYDQSIVDQPQTHGNYSTIEDIPCKVDSDHFWKMETIPWFGCTFFEATKDRSAYCYLYIDDDDDLLCIVHYGFRVCLFRHKIIKKEAPVDPIIYNNQLHKTLGRGYKPWKPNKPFGFAQPTKNCNG
jgi:hypothetical protein